MITNLSVRKIATFDDAGIDLADLKKINFIYGANGCGKTTITNLIHNPTDPIFTNCSVTWKNGMPLKALVYNKDFRDRNFGKGNIDGVFTLGQSTKEDIAAVEKLTAELKEQKEKGVKKKLALEKLAAENIAFDAEYREIWWADMYKKNEQDFKEAFTGFMKSKDAFKSKVIQELTTNRGVLKTVDELKEKAVTIFGKVPVLLASIRPIDVEDLLKIEENDIWQKKIVGKADVNIAMLIQRLQLNDWVNEGRGYLQNNKTCPFCQQPTITASFREELESYFDETFTKDTGLVKQLSDEYNRLELLLSNILGQVETNEKANDASKMDVDSFSTHLRTVSSQFLVNKELLNNKIKEPSRSIDLIPVKAELENIQALISAANIAVAIHNAIVNNYAKERAELIENIWRYLLEEHKVTIEIYSKRSAGYQRGITALGKQREDLLDKYRLIDKNIKIANRNVTSVQPSVDEINKTLQLFGFVNFQIVPSASAKNQYQVHREDGTIAEQTLSEGEVTFITFLYFLQLAKGSTSEESITEERVLIVDDPISSLDSNVLFVVSSLIKEIIKAIKKDEGNIRQLLLLTHNVYFHKEVSFIDGRTPENGDTHYWILRRNGSVSTLQSYNQKSPIHNSYGLLWNELKNRKELSGLTIQNTMRRIIENYFKMLGKYGDDDLIKHFDNQQEQEICRSLICWINDGSHSIPDDLFVEQNDSVIDKYFEVFERIFARMGHSEHYNMMMGTEVNSK